MARAKTKTDLLKSAEDQFNKLLELLSKVEDVGIDNNFTFETSTLKEAHWNRDKNTRDVLIHLHEWHKLLISWFYSNIKNEEKTFLPAPYNWKTYGQMNEELWREHQKTTYLDAKSLMIKTHYEVIDIINNLTNQELFEKSILKWTGGSTFGQYCVSVTSSHYDWAMKKLKLHLKSIQ